MKKIIASALAAAMLVPSAALATETSRTELLSKVTGDNSEIHIVYNDKVVEYQDVKPVNTEGRVMIPFRAALESMGATVEYDEAQRIVTASKGDITIKFTLMDDTIYIDKNGEQSTIKMDVPMIIVDDRTLVPIRFMSNALGMQVGWYDSGEASGHSQTVMIMDYDDYFEELDEIAPNLTKISSLTNPQFNKESMTFDFSMAVGATAPVTCSFNGTLDGNYVDDTLGATVDFDFAVKANEDELNIENSTVEVIAKDGQLYIKSDVIEKIAESSGNIKLKAAAAMIDKNTWYKIDINVLFDMVGIDEQSKNIIKTAISSGSNTNIKQLLKGSMAGEGDADITNVVSIAAQMDMYEQIDKYITVTEKENGGYTVALNITEEDFAAMMANIVGSDDADTISNAAKISIKANTDCDGVKVTSDAEVSLNINAGSSLKMNLKVTSASENDETLQASQIPEDATDITDILTGIVNQ